MADEDIQERLKQKASSERERPESMVGGVTEGVINAGKTAADWFQSGPTFASTGIVDTMGMPGSLGEAQKRLTGMQLPLPTAGGMTKAAMGQDVPSFSDLPSSNDLRGGINEAARMATGDEEAEVVLPPGEEPETYYGRFMQNLGSMLVPMSATQKVKHSVGDLAREIGTEAAGAGLGLGLERTDTFKDNPSMGRLIGEMVGGVGVPVASKGGSPGVIKRGARSLKRSWKNRGQTSEEVRAATRAQAETISPELTLQRLNEPEAIDKEMSGMLPAFVSNDPGVQAITNAAREQDPEFAREFSKIASDQSASLRKAALQNGDPDKATQAVTNRLQRIGAKATVDTAEFKKSGKIADISEDVSNKLDNAFSEGRQMEKSVWNEVPENPSASPANTRSAVKQIYKENTLPSSKAKVPDAIKKNVGEPNKKGKLVGGPLGEKTPKAGQIHEMYSELGDELAKKDLTPKQKRMIMNVRQAALDDLDNVKGGEKYRKAINYSRDLNNKFTKGEIGKVLGFEKGDPVASNDLMNKLAGKQGVEQANAVDELLAASPRTEDNVKDFLRSSFWHDATKKLPSGEKTVNPDRARRFMESHDEVLQKFPDIRSEMEKATDSQEALDNMYKASSVSDMSPYNQEKSAASYFLNQEPTEAMGSIISNSSQRKSKLKKMVKTVQEDGDKGAMQGLKTSFMESLFDRNRLGSLTDEHTQQQFVSGKGLRKNLDDLEESATGSGLFSKAEYGRLKQIANRMEGIENTLQKGATEGGVIEPKMPKKLLDIVVRTSAARGGGAAGGASMGGGLQTANIATSEARKALQTMSNDEAEGLLIQAVRDPEKFKKLMQSDTVEATTKGAKESKLGKLVEGAKEFMNKPGAVTPPATTAGKLAEEKTEEEETTGIQNRLKQQIQQGPIPGGEQP